MAIAHRMLFQKIGLMVDLMTHSVKCQICDGKGRFLGSPCAGCGAHGVICSCGGRYTFHESGQYKDVGVYACEDCHEPKKEFVSKKERLV